MSHEITGGLALLDINECTRVPGPGPRLAAPLGPREAFLVAHERVALLTGIARGSGVVVAAVDANARVMASLHLQDRQALTIGRHTRCGLRLEDDTVSLRHVAVLVRFEGTRPSIHVLDLATNHPFLTEDGQPNAAVIADGPLYISIGSVAIWFLPCSEPALSERADDAWRALAPRAFIDRRAPVEHVRPAAIPLPGPAPRLDSEEITRITRAAPPLLLGDGDEPEIAWGVLRVSAGMRREKRAISAERLDRGVLLGRYSRCSVLLGTPENTISRVHALLIRLGAEVWIIDTASTHGMRRGDELVSADVLRDADTLALSRELTIDWERRRDAEA